MSIRSSRPADSSPRSSKAAGFLEYDIFSGRPVYICSSKSFMETGSIELHPSRFVFGTRICSPLTRFTSSRTPLGVSKSVCLLSLNWRTMGIFDSCSTKNFEEPDWLFQEFCGEGRTPAPFILHTLRATPPIHTQKRGERRAEGGIFEGGRDCGAYYGTETTGGTSGCPDCPSHPCAGLVSSVFPAYRYGAALAS